MYNKKYRSGVTLMELLIVVLVLAALATITIPRMAQSAVRANIRSCAANIDVLNSAIEQYYVTNGAFPANLKDVSKDKNYFPNDQPRCLITNSPYPDTLTSDNRVDASGHTH